MLAPCATGSAVALTVVKPWPVWPPHPIRQLWSVANNSLRQNEMKSMMNGCMHAAQHVCWITIGSIYGVREMREKNQQQRRKSKQQK